MRFIFGVLSKQWEYSFDPEFSIPESNRIITYNGVKGRHGFYDFPNGIQIKSAGEREDPDSDAAKSMGADAHY